MRKYLLAALVAVIAAPSSEACVARRAGARSATKVKTVTRSTARVGVAPAVRNVVTVPFRAVGFGVTACPNGQCPAPAAKK